MTTGTSPQNSQIQLAARAAGWCHRVGVGDHRNSIEAALAFADSFEDGDALGANCEAVGRVFDVAAAEDSPGSSSEGSADSKVGIRRVRILACLAGRGNQNVVFAQAMASAMRGMTALSRPMNWPLTRSAVSSTSR